MNQILLFRFLCAALLMALIVSGGRAAAQLTEPRGFGAAVSVDQTEYSTRISPFEPPTVYMNLRVFNLSDRPALIEFASGQRFDFEIHDSSGELIWRWSDGKFFILILELLTIAPGEELSFAASHTLAAPDGEPLPEGTYTVTGRLASPSSKIEGKTSFAHFHLR